MQSDPKTDHTATIQETALRVLTIEGDALLAMAQTLPDGFVAIGRAHG